MSKSIDLSTESNNILNKHKHLLDSFIINVLNDDPFGNQYDMIDTFKKCINKQLKEFNSENINYYVEFYKNLRKQTKQLRIKLSTIQKKYDACNCMFTQFFWGMSGRDQLLWKQLCKNIKENDAKIKTLKCKIHVMQQKRTK